MPTEGPIIERGLLKNVHLRGCYIPWYQNQPTLVKVEGGGDTYYLPIFSTPDKLKLVVGRLNIEYDSIKFIEDEVEFLSSVPNSVRVMLDLRFEGKAMRWLEVQRG